MSSHGFCFTLNNYSQTQVNNLKASIGHCGITYILFGYESAPTTGTKHLQGYLQSTQKKKDRIYQKFDIYLEAQKFSTQQASDYCKKGGDFFEAGVLDLNVKGTTEKRQGKRTDIDDVKQAIERGESYDAICNSHFETASKINRFIKERIQARDTQKELDSLREEFACASLRPWQKLIVDLVEEAPNPRKIHWIWEAKGNTGKSWMTKYLAAMYGACVLQVGKKQDMAYLYSKNPSRVVVFDLSRTTEPGENREHYLDGVYSLAEDLKNGMVVTYKYDSTNVITRGCHVIFFANFEPDRTKWSADRYFVTELK